MHTRIIYGHMHMHMHAGMENQYTDQYQIIETLYIQVYDVKYREKHA